MQGIVNIYIYIYIYINEQNKAINYAALPKSFHFDVVGGPSTPYGPESDGEKIFRR
jgi:hypothetical protein